MNVELAIVVAYWAAGVVALGGVLSTVAAGWTGRDR